MEMRYFYGTDKKERCPYFYGTREYIVSLYTIYVTIMCKIYVYDYEYTPDIRVSGLIYRLQIYSR